MDARAAKVGQSMATHANTVVKKQEEQDRINAEKLKKQQEAHRLKVEEDERARKQRLEARLAEVKRGLD